MDLRKVKKWHCFFEQSGTFKKQFRKLGLQAVDYDILDDFGETDFKIDLFAQIEAAFEGGGFHFRRHQGRRGDLCLLPLREVLEIIRLAFDGPGEAIYRLHPRTKIGKVLGIAKRIKPFRAAYNQTLSCLHKKGDSANHRKPLRFNELSYPLLAHASGHRRHRSSRDGGLV